MEDSVGPVDPSHKVSPTFWLVPGAACKCEINLSRAIVRGAARVADRYAPRCWRDCPLWAKQFLNKG